VTGERPSAESAGQHDSPTVRLGRAGVEVKEG